jgi:hypothetical protein
MISGISSAERGGPLRIFQHVWILPQVDRRLRFKAEDVLDIGSREVVALEQQRLTQGDRQPKQSPSFGLAG